MHEMERHRLQVEALALAKAGREDKLVYQDCVEDLSRMMAKRSEDEVAARRKLQSKFDQVAAEELDKSKIDHRARDEKDMPPKPCH